MSSSTRNLIIAATILDSVLAGATLDRGVVGFPAWRYLGVRSWAAYSRHADMGTGIFFYPGLAIGGSILSIAAALNHLREEPAPGAAAIPIYGAAALALSGLLMTLKAGPFMLSVRVSGDDERKLQYAFDGLYFWSALRGALQIGAFLANLWSLVA